MSIEVPTFWIFAGIFAGKFRKQGQLNTKDIISKGKNKCSTNRYK